jgi:hypothetical protein
MEGDKEEGTVTEDDEEEEKGYRGAVTRMRSGAERNQKHRNRIVTEQRAKQAGG